MIFVCFECVLLCALLIVDELVLLRRGGKRGKGRHSRIRLGDPGPGTDYSQPDWDLDPAYSLL